MSIAEVQGPGDGADSHTGDYCHAIQCQYFRLKVLQCDDFSFVAAFPMGYLQHGTQVRITACDDGQIRCAN